MKSFPQVLERLYIIQQYDLCTVGVYLGYEWNKVSDEIYNVEFHAYDGAGSFTHGKGETTHSEILDEIMDAIYQNNPDVLSVMIIN